MSEQAFTDQIPKTLAFEGGYGNDPDDPGGETNFGISKAAYPDVDIAGLTEDELGANPALVMDGRIGPATIAASNAADQAGCLAGYKGCLVNHYMAIIAAHPSMAKFQRGWLRRANA